MVKLPPVSRGGALAVTGAAAWLCLAGCAGVAPIPEPAVPAADGDLLVEARRWTEDAGRVAAVARTDCALRQLDGSGGWFEQRLMRVNADPELVYPDALAALPRERRGRIGIYCILGFNQDRGRAPPIIRRAAQRLRELGFQAEVLDSPQRLTAAQSAARTRALLADHLPRVDRAILVGFSKGSADLVEFWFGHAHTLPPTQLRKIRLWANFAGVLRGSEVARWLAIDPGPRAAITRALVNHKSGKPTARFDDLASIAGDPWRLHPRRLPRHCARDLLVINTVVLPDGPSGWSDRDRLFEFLGRQAARGPRTIGPCDGLVESAASVLPADHGLRQWIVRVHGSHAVLDGRFPNGRRIAPGYAQGGTPRLESGARLMRDFVRALPRSAVGL